MRRQTIYLVGIVLVLLLAVQCVANAQEPINAKGTWVLLYTHPTTDGGSLTYVLDANLPNITQCWQRGKLAVTQMYHRGASYECVSKLDFIMREYEDEVIDLYDMEK